MNPGEPSFLVALLEIVWIDLVLSGDNALLIALACRALPDDQRMRGIIFGSAAAIAMRIFFAFVLVAILGLPWIKLAGGLLLLWIAISLAVEGESEGKVTAKKSLWAAVGTIVVADLLMSLDNIVAVTAAAKGHPALVVIGTLLSVPPMLIGSALIADLFTRYPLLVWAGSALLGFVGGELAADDPFIAHLPWPAAGSFVAAHVDPLIGIFGAAIVVCAALLWREARKHDYKEA